MCVVSPIIEGSTEGSSEESKSQAASTLGASAHTLTSTSTSALKTPAASSSGHLLPTAASASDVEMVPGHSPCEPTDQHVIDTSCYTPPEADEKTEALLSMSVCIDPHNPFDEATIERFLKKISLPLEQRAGFMPCNQHVPSFTGCQFVNLGTYIVPLKGGRGFLMSSLPPHVWNLRALSLTPLFNIFSFVLLPSPTALSVLSFSAFSPFSWLLFP